MNNLKRKEYQTMQKSENEQTKSLASTEHWTVTAARRAFAEAAARSKERKRKKAMEKRELTETKGERMAEKRKEKAAALTRAQ